MNKGYDPVLPQLRALDVPDYEPDRGQWLDSITVHMLRRHGREGRKAAGPHPVVDSTYEGRRPFGTTSSCSSKKRRGNSRELIRNLLTSMTRLLGSNALCRIKSPTRLPTSRQGIEGDHQQAQPQALLRRLLERRKRVPSNPHGILALPLAKAAEQNKDTHTVSPQSSGLLL